MEAGVGVGAGSDGGVRVFALAPVSGRRGMGSSDADAPHRAEGGSDCGGTRCATTSGARGGAGAGAAGAGAALAAAGRAVAGGADAVVDRVDAACSACVADACAAPDAGVFPSAAGVTAGGGKGRGSPARAAARFALRRPALLVPPRGGGLDGRGEFCLCIPAVAARRVSGAGKIDILTVPTSTRTPRLYGVTSRKPLSRATSSARSTACAMDAREIFNQKRMMMNLALLLRKLR